MIDLAIPEAVGAVIESAFVAAHAEILTLAPALRRRRSRAICSRVKRRPQVSCAASSSATRGIRIATALLLLGATASQAQDAHHPQPPGAATAQMPVAPPAKSGAMTQGISQMMPMMAPGGMMAGMMPMMDMVDHVEGRLAFLKAELKITDAQMPAWSKFAEAMRVNAAAMSENHAAMMLRQGMSANLPTRLELAERMMSDHLDALRRIKVAVEPLYAVLSDEQKKTADELMGPPHGMM